MNTSVNFIVIFILLISAFVSSDEDYYKLLGVSRSSTKKDIKQAYRKLAVKYHPDKNKDKDAEETFLKITKAYEILSNPEKRNQYDKYGEAAFNQDSGEGFHHFNMNDFFKDFDFFQNHHSSDDFQRHSKGSFFKNLFDDDDDMFGDHFASFDTMFGDQHNEYHQGNGNLHSYHSEQSFSSGGQTCKTVTKKSGNSIMTQTICH